MACGKLSVSINFLIGTTFLKCALATLSYAAHTLCYKKLSRDHVFSLIHKALALSVPDVARVQGGNLVHDAEVTKNLDHISTLFGIDLRPSTGLSGSHGQL